MAPVFSRKDFIATKWFTLEKMIQLIAGVYIVPKIFSALGTIDIGKLNFVESVLSLLAPLFFLGLSAICIREIVTHPKRTQFILITAIYLRLFSWLIIFAGLLIYFNFSNDTSLNALFFIIAVGYLFKLTDVFEYYLIAKKWTKIIFIGKISSLGIIVALQYYGVLHHFEISFFAMLIVLDFLIQGIIYFLILKSRVKWQFRLPSFSWPIGKLLLKMSYPLIISNSLIMFYITIDELFLNYYHGDHDNGIFATVQFLVIILSWNIGFSLIEALYPSLAESYQQNKEAYRQKIIQLSKMTTVLGLAIGVFFTLFGHGVLTTYFSGYEEAYVPLLIFCWAPLFIFIGMIYEKHLVNTNDLDKNVYRFILGCCSNIILCYLLIPEWHATGAAVAVLTSHFISNIAYIFLDQKSRKQALALI